MSALQILKVNKNAEVTFTEVISQSITNTTQSQINDNNVPGR